LNFIQEISFFVIPMGILLLLSAFFSGSETALFSLSSEDRRRLGDHRQVAGLLAALHKNPSGLLTSILFGNLVVNILFFSTGASAAIRLGAARGEWAEALAGLLILILVILLGEIVPKAAGVTRPSLILSLTATPLHLWFLWSAPFRNIIQKLLERLRLSAAEPASLKTITSGELRELLDAVRHEPGFGQQEKEVIEDIITLSEIKAREIMVPRTNVLRYPMDTEVSELLKEARSQKSHRILIYRDREDDLIGYLRLQDLFFASTSSLPIEPNLRPLIFVPETCRADRLLCNFMEKGWDLAGVVDEYGGLSGIITIENILSEVVGEFPEERGTQVVQLNENTYRLSGQLPIRSWRELFTGLLSEPDIEHLAFDTLGGFIISILGRMPNPGDSVTVSNLQLRVEAVSRRRITTVQLHLQSPEEKA